jgi:hypothetical protein
MATPISSFTDPRVAAQQLQENQRRRPAEAEQNNRNQRTVQDQLRPNNNGNTQQTGHSALPAAQAQRQADNTNAVNNRQVENQQAVQNQQLNQAQFRRAQNPNEVQQQETKATLDVRV